MYRNLHPRLRVWLIIQQDLRRRPPFRYSSGTQYAPLVISRCRITDRLLIIRAPEWSTRLTATITADIRPGQQYTFQVSAHDDLGHRSGGSNSVVVVTPVAGTGPDTVPPAAPGNLRADPANGPSTTLTWSAASDNVAVTGYDVYRFDGVFVSTLLATVTGTSYTAPVVSPRDQFYVRARDAAGNVSIASNTVTVTGGTGGPSSPAASPSSSAPPVLSCRARFTYTSVWATGFVADVTVTNTGTTPITDWVITFSFGGDQRVSQAWNATFSQSGAAVTLTRADWNRAIPPGGSVTVGMYGTRSTPPTPSHPTSAAPRRSSATRRTSSSAAGPG